MEVLKAELHKNEDLVRNYSSQVMRDFLLN